MKIGVISDTHIPERAAGIPDEILYAFKKVDMIIHAGDLVEVGVLDQLKAVCPNLKAVCGNMDPEDIRKILPEKEIIKVGKFRIGVMHGQGHPDRLILAAEKLFKQDKVDMVIFGHSHLPVNEERNGVIYFNPGSPTDTIFAPYKSYGIIEINDKIEAKIVKL